MWTMMGSCLSLHDSQRPNQHQVPTGSQAGQKALQINLVLEKVARNLSTGDVCRLRRTCTTWDNIFTDQLLRRCASIPIRLNSHGLAKEMSRYIKSMTKSRLVPFTCYNLELNFEHGRSAGMCRWFFSELGKSVHRLRIEQVDSVTVELATLYRVIFEWTPNLVHLELFLVLGPPGVPKDDEGWPGKYPSVPPEPTVVRLGYLPALKSLALVTDERTVAQEYYNFLVRITQHAVGLEELRLERKVRDYNHLRELQLLPAFRSRNACASLRKLEIGLLTAEDLNTLFELSLLSTSRLIPHLQLCELELQSNSDDLELMALLYELLKTQASTLTALTIDVRRVGKPATVIRFPFLGQLRRLALLNGANEEDDPPVQFDEPSFELNFPKLEELDFRMDGDLRTLQIPHFGIRRLILHSGEGSYHDFHVMGFMNELFPSAESVKLCSTRWFDSIQCYWTHWANVRRIEVEVWNRKQTPYHDPLNFALLYFLTGSRHSARKLWPRFSDSDNKEEGIELARLARLRTNWPGLPIQEFCLSAEATCNCRSAFCSRAEHEGFKIHWT